VTGTETQAVAGSEGRGRHVPATLWADVSAYAGAHRGNGAAERLGGSDGDESMEQA
jgi:hypothetical protein